MTVSQFLEALGDLRGTLRALLEEARRFATLAEREEGRMAASRNPQARAAGGATNPAKDAQIPPSKPPLGVYPPFLEFQWAARIGYIEKMRELLAKGIIDPTARDAFDRTPLHWAATQGYAVAAEVLLEFGADPNTRDKFGRTPLYLAAQRGRAEIVRILLEHGADPNAGDKSGLTPLHRAVSSGRVRVVEILLKYGANPNAKDNSSDTPLHHAALKGR